MMPREAERYIKKGHKTSFKKVELQSPSTQMKQMIIDLKGKCQDSLVHRGFCGALECPILELDISRSS